MWYGNRGMNFLINFCRWNDEPGKNTSKSMIEPNSQDNEILSVSKLYKLYVDRMPLNNTNLMVQS